MVSPQEATQVTPEQVQQIAARAEQSSPSIIDKMSEFYAQHVRLEAATLALAAAHI